MRNPSLLGEDFHRLKRPGGCGGGEAFFCHRHYILSCYSSLWDREAKKQWLVSLCPYEKGRKKNNRNDFRNQINIVKSKPFCALNFNRLIGLLPPSFRITYHVCVHVCLKERVFVWSLLFLWLLLSTERKNKISSGQRQKQEIEKVFSAPKDLMEFRVWNWNLCFIPCRVFFFPLIILSHTHIYI